MTRPLALRALFFFVLFALLALASGFLAPLRVSAATSQKRTLQSGGIARTYHVYRPASLGRQRPVALVVMLHGGFGTGLQAERAYHWDAAAERYGFVVVYPDGIDYAWNAGDCCGQPQKRNLDDVGFLTALVERLERDENVDPHRIYVTGMSNGAMMAYRMACEAPLAIAAIGPVAGTQSVDCAHPRPTSLLAIHGLDDGNVPFNGGLPRKGATAKLPRRAVPDVIAEWRAGDACRAPSLQSAGSVMTSRASCAGGREVNLIAIAGAGHQWPGGEPPSAFAQVVLAPFGGLDPPSSALDATAVLWTFFAAHRS